MKLKAYIKINTISIEVSLFMIMSVPVISLIDKFKHIWYKIPNMKKALKLFSFIIIVFISSFDIENKKYERIIVKTKEIIIITYLLFFVLP